MIKQVRKREGDIVDFSQDKITQAVYKALKAVGRDDEALSLELSDKVVRILNNKFHYRSIPAIEEIQDIVEEVLIKEDLFKAAKAYIIYREQHSRLRDLKKLIDSDDVINGYLKQLDWRIKENANMAYSLQGLNNHVASAVSSHYWLNRVYPPEIREAHVGGAIHLHDLQILAVYCCGWDLQALLRLGFGGVEGKVSSKPAKHLRVALSQMVNFFYTLQGEAAGAEAFANFDTLLAPFVRYDGLGEKEVRQAMQEFVFSMNVPTRVGFQCPFTNLTFDLICPSIMANEAVIIGGLPQKETYKEFQPEMDMINRAFAEVMMAGDANGRVFTFPIPTYNISTDFNWDNKVLDPIWEMTAKYGIPYFANFVNSDMKPEDARSMCISPKEEVLVRNSANIKRLSFGQMVDKYRKTEFDQNGWADCDLSKNLELLSLNPQTGKMEWAKALSFLKVEDKRLIRIKAEDGKSFEVSSKHIVPVLTENGIVNKFAKDIKKGDYLFNLKRADEILNTGYQWIGDFILNEDLAKILGFFTADGNYLFENRKNMKALGQPRGMQFTFNAQTKKNLAEVKKLIEKIFKTAVKEKKDPRYNSYYLYVYNTGLARKLFAAGFKK
ncbi:ribonucleoside triphosphate reductase, partial [Candidatus Falkowbacteria bacterium]|nr:ribonucleoside triphosphate reductase [Candidatus Falkowbacteria bacterium]